MNLKNYKDYACFDYESEKCPYHKLGDVVIQKETKEIGVIIQIHGEGEYRVDMFGNCDISEIKMATKKEIDKYRPNLLSDGHFAKSNIKPMNLSEKEKRQIFWVLLNEYPKYERDRKQAKLLFDNETIKAGISTINRQEKSAYNLIKKFADEIGQKIPEYKNPE